MVRRTRLSVELLERRDAPSAVHGALVCPVVVAGPGGGAHNRATDVYLPPQARAQAAQHRPPQSQVHGIVLHETDEPVTQCPAVPPSL